MENVSGIDDATMIRLIRARAANINSASVKDLFDKLSQFQGLGYRFNDQTRLALVNYVNEILKKVEPKLKSNPKLQTLVGNNVGKFYDKINEMKWVKSNKNPSADELRKCGHFLYDLLAA